MKVAVIGDLHMKDKLGYADLVEDGRESERKAVLDFIVEKSKDCDAIVFLGDQFHTKNPSAETIRMFTEFLEMFGDKPLYLLAGNHEVSGDGTSALDYLKEINGKDWNVFKEIAFVAVKTDSGEAHFQFVPWVPKTVLGTQTNEEAGQKIIGEFQDADYAFAHYAVSGCDANGVSTSLFNEPVLPAEELQRRFKRVLAGHIHTPQTNGNVTVVGSVFTNEVGEEIKRVVILDTEKNEIETFVLPCRPILKLVDAKEPDMERIPDNAIVKMEIRDPELLKELAMEAIECELAHKTDGFVITKNVKTERERLVDTKDGIPDLGVKNLLRIYAETKDINLSEILHGYELTES